MCRGNTTPGRALRAMPTGRASRQSRALAGGEEASSLKQLTQHHLRQAMSGPLAHAAGGLTVAHTFYAIDARSSRPPCMIAACPTPSRYGAVAPFTFHVIPLRASRIRESWKCAVRHARSDATKLAPICGCGSYSPKLSAPGPGRRSAPGANSASREVATVRQRTGIMASTADIAWEMPRADAPKAGLRRIHQ